MEAEKNLLIENNKEQWKKILTEPEYRVLVNKGTEKPFDNQYYYHKEKGIYTCAACNNILFNSEEKFESGSGWPSFKDVISEKAVGTRKDNSQGMNRTEVFCNRCGGHLGHLFEDGPEPTGLRYCINSTSLNFLKEAYFALGCFWKPDALFGSLDGVYFTEVGYAGGEMNNPTYQNLGKHSETVKVVYDPEVINFEKLLETFGNNHELNSRSYSSQYKSIIFYNSQKQKNAAQKYLQSQKEKMNKNIYTEVTELDNFYQAETYHQKYNLRQNNDIFEKIKNIFPVEIDLTDYRIMTKLNAYSGSYINREEIKNELKNSWIYIKYQEEIKNIIDNL